MPTNIVFNLSLPATIGVELDQEALDLEIRNVLRDEVAYQLRDQIHKQIQSWVNEEMQAKKEVIMKEIAPEIEKHMRNWRR